MADFTLSMSNDNSVSNSYSMRMVYSIGENLEGRWNFNFINSTHMHSGCKNVYSEQEPNSMPKNCFLTKSLSLMKYIMYLL